LLHLLSLKKLYDNNTNTNNDNNNNNSIHLFTCLTTAKNGQLQPSTKTTTTTTKTIIIIQFNSILYFNVLTQQLQEPITESAQEDKYIHSK
jgi:hypothetical protein